MATYKVPQDVEAEDKLVGFLSFRQFIFVLLGLAFSAMTFFGIRASVFIGVWFIPPAALFLLLGLYQPKDQPVETKLVALFNFFIRPRKRLWDRDGISEHVVIKVPKKVEKHYSDNRTRQEVRSQLKNLAQIIDTRGWSIKRAEIQLPGASGTIALMPGDDRLINPTQFQVYADPLDVHQEDDMMDEHFNPVAQIFDAKAQETAQAARAHAVATLQSAQSQPPPALPTTQAPIVRQQSYPTSQDDQTEDIDLPEGIHFQPYPTSIHQNVIQPLSGSVHSAPAGHRPPAPKRPSVKREEIIEDLARNEDLSVSRLAAQAQQHAALEEDEDVALH